MTRKLMFIVGIVLFLINVMGVFIPLRNGEIYSEQDTKFQDDIILDENQLWERINSDSSDVATYVTSLNAAVNNGIAHYWSDEGIEKYNLRIPFYENYFLYIAGWIYPPVFEKYEYSHYKKAIKRGVGLCSQHAIIVSEILKDRGMQSKIVGLDGHVVATTTIDREKKQWWILDPDHGVIIPYSIDKIESDPSIITPYYSQAGYDTKQIDELIDIFGPEGNKVVNGVREYDPRIKSYSLRYYIESFTYIMKWLLPLLLVIPYVRGFLRDGGQIARHI